MLAGGVTLLHTLGDIVLDGVFSEIENGPVAEGAFDVADVRPDLLERLDALELKLREQGVEEGLHRPLLYLRIGNHGLADPLRAIEIPLRPELVLGLTAVGLAR